MNKTRLSHVSFLVVCALWVQSSLAQDYTPWSLSAEAPARSGKASIGAGVWLDDTDTSAEIALLTGHTDEVYSVAFSPDGKTLASASLDGSVLLWNVESGQLIKTLGHTDEAYSVAFAPDGKTLASGSGDGTVRLWNIESGQLINTLTGHTDDVLSVAFAPDGKTLASDTRLWDVASGQRIKTLDYADFVYSVAFAPDGNTLASVGEDSTVRLWNIESEQLINRLTGHTGRVLSVAFAPDGKILASAGEDGTVRLWNIESGQLINRLTGHGGWVYSVAFSPDGNTLASGSWDGTVLLWDMSPYITPAEPTAIQSSAPRLLPAVSGLEPNYPNPFNTSTYLIYRLATPGAVRLKIYNALGQPVRTLVDQYQPAGFYQVAWDGRDQRGTAVAAGVYLTRLFYPGGEQTRRMLLLK